MLADRVIRLRRESGQEVEHVLHLREDVELHLAVRLAHRFGQVRGCRPATSRIRQPGYTPAATRAGRRAADWPADACRLPFSPRNVAAMPWMTSRATSTSRSLLVSKVPPVPSMSSHGDSGIVAAGSGSPCSRTRRIVVIARPPPAESPVSAMCFGLMPWSSSHLYAFAMSLTGPGCTFSGASP